MSDLEHVAGDDPPSCPVLALMLRTDAPDVLLRYHVTACLRCASMIQTKGETRCRSTST